MRSASIVTDRPDAAATVATPSCIDDGKPDDAVSVRERIAYLASEELDGRAAGSPGDAAAVRYITERFRCLGLSPGGDAGSYEQRFALRTGETANVIGYLAGDDPTVGNDIIVIGAHHDHLGDKHLGANDNASGIAAVLSIAQAIQQHAKQTKLHRTVAFIAFGGEELGLLGSEYFTAHPPAALPIDRIVYDINLDMVGSYRSKHAVYAMGTFRKLPGTAIVEALQVEHKALHVGIGGRGVGSDHAAFCKAGVPYVFFWTPDTSCYHQTCDTVDKLDLTHMIEIATFADELTEQLANSATDLAASRAEHGCGG